MVVQEMIGPLCHRVLAFNINEAFIIFMFVAMCFASGLLRIRRPRLERFAFIIPEILLTISVCPSESQTLHTCSISYGTLTISKAEDAVSGYVATWDFRIASAVFDVRVNGDAKMCVRTIAAFAKWSPNLFAWSCP